MQIDRIVELRDHLVRVKAARRREVGFNMALFAGRLPDKAKREREPAECQTTACLGGHVLVMQGMSARELRSMSIEQSAGEYLGLTPHERMYMFFGKWGADTSTSAYNASIDDAIAYLNKVIAEGTVFVKVPITGVVR